MTASRVALAIVALSTLAAPGAAQAQTYTNYKYCAQYSLQTMSCAFDTWEQCMANVSGRGGFCVANTAYQGRASGSRRPAGRR